MSVRSSEIPTNNAELLTREQWDEMVDLRVREAEATGNTSLGIIFMDINFFKSVNDEIGHEKGDEVIAEVGELITNVATWFRAQANSGRQPDVVSHESLEDAKAAKWGGDEFTVLTHSDENGVRDFVERVRSDFADYITQPEQKQLRDLGVGLAIGASMYEPGETPEGFTSKASEAMKQDKKRQLPELTPFEQEVSDRIQNLLDKVDNPDILLRHLVRR